MPLNTKKYLITTEKHEVYVVRQNNLPIEEFCNDCRMVVEMLNLDAAVTHMQIRTHEVFRLIELGKLHSIETHSGHLFVCKNSIFR